MENTAAHPWTKNYQPGVPAEIELPTESLVAMLERSVAEAGAAPALEFFGRRTSYTELGVQVDRLRPRAIREISGICRRWTSSVQSMGHAVFLRTRCPFRPAVR